MATQLHDKVVEQMNYDVDDMDIEETAACWSGCGCLQGLFCFWWCTKNNINGCSRAYLLGRREGEEGVLLAVVVKDKYLWLVKKAKKVKEVSEVLAGPRWKNFIRSINKKKRMKFQYDPQSYALNFDDGVHLQTQPDSEANQRQILA